MRLPNAHTYNGAPCGEPGCQHADCDPPYTPRNADPLPAELELAGPGWALFNGEVDDGGHWAGDLQADDESGIFTAEGVTRDDRAHYMIAFDYARMRQMLESLLPIIEITAKRAGTREALGVLARLEALISEVQP